tara:strand:+ start:10486 stop:10869 length:384 start_codon:yes stop_codon:yes gene_type:complete
MSAYKKQFSEAFGYTVNGKKMSKSEYDAYKRRGRRGEALFTLFILLVFAFATWFSVPFGYKVSNLSGNVAYAAFVMYWGLFGACLVFSTVGVIDPMGCPLSAIGLLMIYLPFLLFTTLRNSIILASR